MAEFLVGLVCIMLLLAGMQQVSILSQRGFTAMNNARYQMAKQLMDPPNQALKFRFAMPAQAGPDGEYLTADDRTRVGDDVFFQSIHGYLNKVNDPGIGNQLGRNGLYNPDNDLKYSEVYSKSSALPMYHAADLEKVDWAPFLGYMLGHKDKSFLIERSLWMPGLDRID